jgi:hypothetical protein
LTHLVYRSDDSSLLYILHLSLSPSLDFIPMLSEFEVLFILLYSHFQSFLQFAHEVVMLTEL